MSDRKIQPDALQSLTDKGLADAEIAETLGCKLAAVRRARKRFDMPSLLPPSNRSNQDHIRETTPDMGRGGDIAFDRLMGERRFDDHPRAKPSQSIPRLWPHTSGHLRSLTGCAASLACV